MTLRPSTLSDLPFVWFCRNDPVMRAMSNRRHEIPWEEIRTWTPLIYEVDGLPMGYGYVRDGEITYSLAPPFRYQGHGPKLIRELVATTPGQPLRAEMRNDNHASISAIIKAGFVFAEYTPTGLRRYVSDPAR